MSNEVFQRKEWCAIVLKSRGQKSGSEVTSGGLLQLATMGPNVSNNSLQKSLKHVIKSKSTIMDAKLRVAACITHVGWAKVFDGIVGHLPLCLAPKQNTPSLDLCGPPKIQPSESLVLRVDPLVQEPRVIIAKWKFDSTPDKSARSCGTCFFFGQLKGISLARQSFRGSCEKMFF